MGGYIQTPYYLDDLERLKSESEGWPRDLFNAIPTFQSPLDVALQAGGAAPTRIDPNGAFSPYDPNTPSDPNAPRKLTSDITPRAPEFADVNSKGDGSHVWVTMDGKTYDYSSGGLGVTGHVPTAPDQTVFHGSTEVTPPPSMFGQGIMGSGMPPTRISPEGLAAQQESGATGVSMMPGTDDQQHALRMEELAKQTDIAGGQADLFKQQLLGPAIPGQQRPRSWLDVKQDEQRQRQYGILETAKAKYAPTLPNGQLNPVVQNIAAQVAAGLAAANPQAWAALTPEVRKAQIEQAVHDEISASITTEFNQNLAVEGLSMGISGPAANLLRQPTNSPFVPAYWGQGGYPGTYP